MDIIQLLKSKEKQIRELEHAYRINGVLDIWKKHWTVYNLPENKYHNFNKLDDLEKYVLNEIEKLPIRDPFKKTAKGRMTMQEFRNNQYNAKLNANAK